MNEIKSGTKAPCSNCGKEVEYLVAPPVGIGWVHDWREDCGQASALGNTDRI